MITKPVVVQFAAVAFLATSANGATGDVHDAAAEWSTTANPNGNWEYLHWDENVPRPVVMNGYYASSNNGTPLAHRVFFGRDFWASSVPQPPANSVPPNCCLIEASTFAANPSAMSPLRLAPNGPLSVEWTAPTGVGPAASIFVSSEQIFEPGRQQRVLVKHNGIDIGLLEATSVGGMTERQYATMTLTRYVSPGDTLNFVMDPYGSMGNGLTTLHMVEVIITEVPEPASLLLLGLGVLVNCKRRTRLRQYWN